MKLTLSPDEMNAYCNELQESNAIFKADYPADSFQRQPVHTVYGGANLFQADFSAKLGEVALKTLETHAPNYSVFDRALGLPGAETLPTNPVELASLTRALEANPEQVRGTKQAALLSYSVCNRVVKKLQSEPVAVRWIDFQDGYGIRTDAEEDSHVASATDEVAKGMSESLLSPFIGNRVKTFSGEYKARSIRTQDIFLTRLAEMTGTASCNITAAHQSHTLSACDFARHVWQVSLAGTGITINVNDGASTLMPISPQKAAKDAVLSAQQMDENRAVVHGALKLHYDNFMHSPRHGYDQGRDLYPGQLPVRYAAMDALFLSGLQDASARLNAFLNKPAKARLVGNTFDKAATGPRLLNFFLRVWRALQSTSRKRWRRESHWTNWAPVRLFA